MTEKLSGLRSDFKRSWILSGSCFLTCLHIGTLHILNRVCKNTAWMGTLKCGGLCDSLIVTWQFKNRNRNTGFLQPIVSIRTILLRATKTKGLAFKIYYLKGKLHFFGQVQMYFIQFFCYFQSLVVNKYDFYPGSHTSGLQCLQLFSSSSQVVICFIMFCVCRKQLVRGNLSKLYFIIEEFKCFKSPVCKIATAINFLCMTLKS